MMMDRLKRHDTLKGLEWKLVRFASFHKTGGGGDLAAMEAERRSNSPGVKGTKKTKTLLPLVYSGDKRELA